jgi:hypothetical protein
MRGDTPHDVAMAMPGTKVASLVGNGAFEDFVAFLEFMDRSAGFFIEERRDESVRGRARIWSRHWRGR